MLWRDGKMKRETVDLQLCDICGKSFDWWCKRLHCPDCAEELKRQYKEIWRLRHPDYNRKYLREWKRDLKELEIVQRNKAQLAAMA